MTKHRNRLSRAAADHLLDGAPTAYPDAVADVLAAARADGVPHEVRGLDAALSAFATASPPAVAIQPERSTPVLKRLVTAKVIGAAIGAVALGGVALAASTGTLPSPLPHSDNAASAARSHVPTALPSQVSGTHGSPDEVRGSQSSEASESESNSESNGQSPESSASPSPSLPGLCQSWLSRPHDHGSADTNPAFTVLVQAAGGTDKVAGYCTALLATSRPTHPSGKPSDVPPTTNQHGRPSDVPPTSHPSAPASLPPAVSSHPAPGR